MKQLILAILILTGVSFGQTARTARDSVTTLKQTDIMSWQTSVGGVFKGRQMSWRLMSAETRAYVLSSTNTFTGLNYFNGGVHLAGAHGEVTFADSVWMTAELYTSTITPRTNLAWGLGQYGRRYLWGYIEDIYTAKIHILDPASSDSTDGVEITYDGRYVDFGTVNLTADTITGLTAISQWEGGHTVSSVTDSIITVDYGNNVAFLLPGANMLTLEHITMSEIPTGAVHNVTFWILDSQDYNIIFHDVDGTNSSDGNLQLNGDFDMDAGDSLTLQWRDGQTATSGGDWQEVSRSNNR